jgi:tRNA (cytidine/uridine-2'-O-)-methyltransferase
MSPAFKIILFQPEIPQNTGNIGRLCAVTGAELHLIHPLGFTITDRHLRRSGMDYWKSLTVVNHDSWEAFVDSADRPQRVFLVTTRASRIYWDVPFLPGDAFLFGQESAGCPQHVHDWAADNRITVPRLNPNMRSLNLSTCAGIVLYEALRQNS